MKLNQLSVFLENKTGRLSAPCTALAEAGINIATLSLADTREFGILRLIVRDWEKARDVLVGAGYLVNVTEVIAAAVADRPGGLAAVLDRVEKAGLNLEYMYAFTVRSGDRAVLVLRFEDPDAALQLLSSSGVDVIDGITIFDQLDT